MSVIGWTSQASLQVGCEQDRRRIGPSFFLDLALGTVGALLVASSTLTFFGGPGVTGFNLGSFLVVILGSIIVLVAYHAVTASRAV